MIATVVIVAYDTESATKQLLQRWKQFAGNLPDSARFVIWDNAGHGLDTHLHPEITYISSRTNFGFGQAINKAVEQSRGETPPAWILVLNPDVDITIDTLKCCLASMAKQSADVLWAPSLDNPDGSPQTRRGTLFLRNPLQEVLESFGIVSYRRPEQLEYLRGAVLAIPYRKFLASGGFDPNFFLYAEEVDLCVRLQRSGMNLVLDEEIRIPHKGSQGLFAKSDFSAGHYLASKTLLSRKYNGTLASLAVHISVNLGLAAYVLRGKLSRERRSRMLRERSSALTRIAASP